MSIQPAQPDTGDNVLLGLVDAQMRGAAALLQVGADHVTLSCSASGATEATVTRNSPSAVAAAERAERAAAIATAAAVAAETYAHQARHVRDDVVELQQAVVASAKTFKTSQPRPPDWHGVASAARRAGLSPKVDAISERAPTHQDKGNAALALARIARLVAEHGAAMTERESALFAALREPIGRWVGDFAKALAVAQCRAGAPDGAPDAPLAALSDDILPPKTGKKRAPPVDAAQRVVKRKAALETVKFDA